MQNFKFPLQRVLEWRALQLRSAEEKLAELQQQLFTVQRDEAGLAAAGVKSGSILRTESISGADLQALSAYRAQIRRQRELLEAKRARCEAAIAEQRTR